MADEIVDNIFVTAILVTHDGATYLPKSVASIGSQSRAVDYVIAIDTGSTDSSVELLKNAKIPVKEVARTIGFGAAISAAIEDLGEVEEGATEWLWLLHDDCAPESGALQALIAAVSTRPTVAIAGPKIRGWYNQNYLLESGVSIAGNGARWTGLEIREYDQGQHDGIREVLAVSTAGMFIRRDVFEELGGFDPRLPLFRDDVDLGWRARMAGHNVIAVSDAVLLHAQASASERRSIDVAEGFLHRPLLLDRQSAAYVLLANSSWWMLPWLALQLLTSAVGRAVGYLVAKLPGYAADEILAVALIIVKPQQLGKARRNRRKERLLPSRVIAPFIPPRTSQIRLTFSRASAHLRERLLPTPAQTTSALDEINEDEDLLMPGEKLPWRNLLRRPDILTYGFLFLVTTLWARNRFGTVVGGALAQPHSGATALLRAYFESWHQVGMGSTIASPPWLFILGLLSALTFGKVWLLITLILWLGPIAFMASMHNLLRHSVKNRNLVLAASLGYAISPVAIAAINAGRLGTIVVLALAPQIVRFLPRMVEIESFTWRRIAGISLLLTLIISFSLPAFIAFLFYQVAGVVFDYRRFKDGAERALFDKRVIRRGFLVLAPFFMTLPWSTDAVLHPSRFLLEPGLAIAGGGPNLALSLNPGGVGALPWWFITPLPVVLIAALFSASRAKYAAMVGAGFLALSILLSGVAFPARGNSRSVELWVGTFIACATLAAIFATAIILDGVRVRLAKSSFNYRHILAGLLVITSVISTVGISFWAVTIGANSPARVTSNEILPPFLKVQPAIKTLVLSLNNRTGHEELSFFIGRSDDLKLGEADVAPVPDSDVSAAVRNMVNGSGVESSKTLAEHGIKYVFIKNPANKNLVQAIDGLGGFIRNSQTSAGIVWRVAGISEHLTYKSTKDVKQSLPSTDSGAEGVIPGVGTINLAESFDRSWQILADGKLLPSHRALTGLTEFDVTQQSNFILFHNGATRRAWLSLEFIFFASVLLISLPSGRRKRDIADAELS
ncbi:MAG: glycosyltransferase [Actinobacteria bacterium]|uniref:Unannotated protein n=1 Tax=freshwater metagenome TaxID=449393 RepID=A0A6J7IM78_9ZZZZ|nr:glycosyltransferase [Actinomycetota bacterium]